MAIARVNTSTGFSSGATSATTIPVPAFSVTTGNAVIACFSLYQSGSTISSVTDNAGNTYALLGTLYGGDTNHKMGVYLATNVTGNASLVVTANLSATAAFRLGVAAQYSGLGSYDAGSTGKLDSNTPAHTTNAVTTTAAGDLVIGWFVTFADSRTFSQSGSWTLVQQAGDAILVDQVVGAAGSYSAAVNTNLGTDLASVARAFKAGVTLPQGQGSGTYTWAATQNGKRTPKATGAGTYTWAGTQTGKRAPVAAGTATYTWAATATGTRAARASASGTYAWAGTGTGSTPSAASGTGAGTYTWVGVAVGASAPRGTSSSTYTWAGSATGKRVQQAATSGTYTWAGTSTGKRVARASVAGTYTWAGTATGDTPSDFGATIALENAKAGDASGWAITGSGDTANIGFARNYSTNAGSTVQFSCHGNGTVIDIYRIGWYGGAGWRKITTLTNTATTQPNAATIASSNGGTTCTAWSVTASWAIPSDALSGFFIGVYRNSGLTNASYIPFIVRNDSRTADVVYKTSDSTWAVAYNNHGTNASPLAGKTFYGTNDSAGTPAWDIANRAHALSYHRPVVSRAGHNLTYWLNAEAPMIRFLERNGIDVEYIGCQDLNAAAPDPSQILISSGHDEYWSQGMRDNAEAHRDAGGHLLFLTGNEVFWRIRMVNASGDPQVWCYKDTMTGPGGHVAGTALDPVSWTGTWKDTRWGGRKPENTLTGTDFRMNGTNNLAVTINSATYGGHPFWRNTTVVSTNLTTGAGIVGFEADQIVATQPPASRATLAAQTININGSYADNNGENYTGNGSLSPWGIIAQRYQSGAVVVGFGTCQWSWGLDATHDNGTDITNTALRQATLNLFADLGALPATTMAGLTTPTPVSNLSVYGAIPGPPQGQAGGTYTWASSATGKKTQKATASGSYTWAGSATGQRAPKATAATGTYTWAAGTVTGKRTPKASASGTYAWATGTVAGRYTPKASTAGAYAWAGTATGSTPAVGAHSGNAAGSYGWVSTAAGSRTPRGQTSSLYGWAGTGAGVRHPLGAATGTYGWVMNQGIGDVVPPPSNRVRVRAEDRTTRV